MNDCLGRKVITDSFFLMPGKAGAMFFYFLLFIFGWIPVFRGVTRLCNISFSFQKGINGQERIRTFEGVSQWIYSPPRLTASVPTRRFIDK